MVYGGFSYSLGGAHEEIPYYFGRFCSIFWPSSDSRNHQNPSPLSTAATSFAISTHLAADFLSNRTHTSASALLPVMETYREQIFLRSIERKISNHHLLHAELLARKSFFLLVALFDQLELQTQCNHLDQLRDEISQFLCKNIHR
jgi:hypothetical protein